MPDPSVLRRQLEDRIRKDLVLLHGLSVPPEDAESILRSTLAWWIGEVSDTIAERVDR